MKNTLAIALKQIVDTTTSGNQSEAAKAFDMHRQDLNAVIKGKRGLTDEQIMAISKVTNTSIGYWNELQRGYRLSKKDGMLPTLSPQATFVQHMILTGGGILIDTDIFKALESDFISIEPFEADNVQPASYDLTYGRLVFRTEDGEIQETADSFEIAPGKTALIESNESLCLNRQVLATIGNMTAWINKGVIFQRAAQIDPGYEGRITVRAENVGSESQTIPKAESIMTLTFHFLPRIPTKDAPERKDAKLILEDLRGDIANSDDPGRLLRDMEKLMQELKGAIR